MTPALIWHFIARPWRLPAEPLHDTVEGLEIRSPFAVRKEPRCFKRGDFFGDGGSHELVDAGSILTANRSTACFRERGSRSRKGYVFVSFMII
jgi:hypothetical protein